MTHIGIASIINKNCEALDETAKIKSIRHDHIENSSAKFYFDCSIYYHRMIFH